MPHSLSDEEDADPSRRFTVPATPQTSPAHSRQASQVIPEQYNRLGRPSLFVQLNPVLPDSNMFWSPTCRGRAWRFELQPGRGGLLLDVPPLFTHSSSDRFEAMASLQASSEQELLAQFCLIALSEFLVERWPDATMTEAWDDEMHRFLRRHSPLRHFYRSVHLAHVTILRCFDILFDTVLRPFPGRVVTERDFCEARNNLDSWLRQFPFLTDFASRLEHDLADPDLSEALMERRLEALRPARR
ncbi:hypothetical protein OIO90_004603 [Microbotryomycetes sp. JL221]|nr:hypothetical protein OIO90_004603 [Microbotryomycetes sp. JL221]